VYRGCVFRAAALSLCGQKLRHAEDGDPILAKYDGIKGHDILEIQEGENELTLILRDNRYLFIKVVDGKLVTDSVPE